MSSPSDQSKTSRIRFRACEINSTVQTAIWQVRHSAKVPALHRDSALIMACAVAADIWTRYNLLFHDSAKIADDTARDRVAAILWEAVDPVLHRICDLRPATTEGYRARAAVFLAWDAGEMLARAESGGALDKLPLAVVLDLLNDYNTE